MHTYIHTCIRVHYTYTSILLICEDYIYPTQCIIYTVYTVYSIYIVYTIHIIVYTIHYIVYPV